jgi:hypothetical protein
VLFSRDDVASFIDRNFEPVWQSVRPVPVVQIDFGSETITRTLHGNIATYACTADGEVLDILPGIYTPDAYLSGLNQLRLLAVYVKQGGKTKGVACLRQYHEAQLEALRARKPGPRLVESAGVTKALIERSIQVALVPGNTPDAKAASTRPAGGQPQFKASEDGELWKLLIEDTFLNENTRRRQIHEMLANAGPFRPEQIVGRLYKEVLHTDLDDPYLGLGSVLFTHYPFASEDKTR